jgi:hypothetical protein
MTIMSKVIRVHLYCALLGTTLALGSSVLAGKPLRVQSKPAQSTESMEAFWEKFKAAVIKGDKETVAALTEFPLSLSYGMSDIKNKAQFMRRFRMLFFEETNATRCFSKAKPLVYPPTKRPKEFIITCSFASEEETGQPFEYRFTLTRKGWRFTSFTNVNE